MIGVLQDDLQNANQIDLARLVSQLCKLHCLKAKLKNYLTPDLARDIKISMPTGFRKKDGRILFIKVVSHTFLDKEAHKRIIYEYIIKLEITESNNMEGFQQELRRHIKQYDAIQENEWKKITNHVIRQYHKINSAPFQMGFNMKVFTGLTKVQKIRLAMHSPRMDKHHTSWSKNSKYLSRNKQQPGTQRNAHAWK
jgi:hypothetical protein